MREPRHTVGDGQWPIAARSAGDGGAGCGVDILVGGCWRLSSRQFLRTEKRAGNQTARDWKVPRIRRLENLRYDVWPPCAMEWPFPPPPPETNV
jgi:hypothetical protein